MQTSSDANRQFRYDPNTTIFEIPKSLLDGSDARIRIFILEDTVDTLKKKIIYSDIQLAVKDQALKMANDQIAELQMDQENLKAKVAELEAKLEEEKRAHDATKEDNARLVNQLEIQRQEFTEKLQIQIFNAQCLLEEKETDFEDNHRQILIERNTLKNTLKVTLDALRKHETINEILSTDPTTQVYLKCSDGVKLLANRSILSHYSPVIKAIIEKSYGGKIYHAISCGASIKTAILGSDSVLIPDFDSKTVKAALAWMNGHSSATDGLLDFSHRYQISELKVSAGFI